MCGRPKKSPVVWNCSKCLKVFQSKSHLKRHQNIKSDCSITAEKSYQCNSCFKTFVHLQSLKTHWKLSDDPNCRQQYSEPSGTSNTSNSSSSASQSFSTADLSKFILDSNLSSSDKKLWINICVGYNNEISSQTIQSEGPINLIEKIFSSDVQQNVKTSLVDKLEKFCKYSARHVQAEIVNINSNNGNSVQNNVIVLAGYSLESDKKQLESSVCDQIFIEEIQTKGKHSIVELVRRIHVDGKPEDRNIYSDGKSSIFCKYDSVEKRWVEVNKNDESAKIFKNYSKFLKDKSHEIEAGDPDIKLNKEFDDYIRFKDEDNWNAILHYKCNVFPDDMAKVFSANKSVYETTSQNY